MKGLNRKAREADEGGEGSTYKQCEGIEESTKRR